MCPHGTTKQGFEIQFGTNHLSHFLLTTLLLDLVKKSNGRIINVSSNAAHVLVSKKEEIEGFCSFEESTVIGSCESTNVYKLYGRSKLANLIYSKKLARELEKNGSKATTYSLNPGAVKTNLTRHFGSAVQIFHELVTSHFFKTPWQGTQTTLQVALAPKD